MDIILAYILVGGSGITFILFAYFLQKKLDKKYGGKKKCQ